MQRDKILIFRILETVNLLHGNKTRFLHKFPDTEFLLGKGLILFQNGIDDSAVDTVFICIRLSEIKSSAFKIRSHSSFNPL